MKKTILLMAMVIFSTFFFTACGSTVASNGNADFASGGNAVFVSGGNAAFVSNGNAAPVATAGNAG